MYVCFLCIFISIGGKPIPNLWSSTSGFRSWSGGGVDRPDEGWVMLTRSLSSLHWVEIFDLKIRYPHKLEVGALRYHKLEVRS